MYAYARMEQPPTVTSLRPPCWPEGWTYYPWMDMPTPPGWEDGSDEEHYPDWWPFPIQHVQEPGDPLVKRSWTPSDIYGVFIVSPNDRSVIGSGVAFSVEAMILCPNGTYPQTGTVTISKGSGNGTLAFASGATISYAAESHGTLTGVTYTLAGGATEEMFTLKATLSVAGQDDRTFYAAVHCQAYGFIVTAPASVQRDTAFDVTVQAITRSTSANYSYTPDDTVQFYLARKSDSGDDITPTMTSGSDWTAGAKTVSCTISGGSAAGATARIFAVDTATGISGSTEISIAGSYGFVLTIDGYVVRGTPFNVTIQAVDSSGSNDTDYVPTGTVALSLIDAVDENAALVDAISPTTTDSSGWTNGAKTVACTLSGGSSALRAVLVATDTVTAQRGVKAITIYESFTYTLPLANGSENMKTLFNNPTAGDFNVEAVLVSMTPNTPASVWNHHNSNSYQGGGIFINATGIPVSWPGVPVQATECLPGFVAGGFATREEAEAYSAGKSATIYLPAGQLYWYWNDNPPTDNAGSGASYIFTRL